MSILSFLTPFKITLVCIAFLALYSLKISVERAAVIEARAQWQAEQNLLTQELEDKIRRRKDLEWQRVLEAEIAAQQEIASNNTELRIKLDEAENATQDLEDEIDELLAKPERQICFDDNARRILDSLRYD